MMSVSQLFMPIPPRHRRALEMLADKKKCDTLGGIGVGAIRDEDDVFTLEQIVTPLWERGLVEDLTETELGASGRFFIRLTRTGEICLALGVMLRDSRKITVAELTELSTDHKGRVQLSAPQEAAHG
jgi:hypothetical protein